MISGYKLFLLGLSIALAEVLQAQEHTPQRPLREWASRATDAYSQHLYDVAALDAREYLRRQCISGVPQGMVADEAAARYFQVAARLYDGKADSALNLLQRTTDKAIRDRLALGIARTYFLKGSLAEAILFYKEAGIENLANAEIVDSKFELAYCLFNVKQFDEAAPLFATIREVPGKYYSAGNYYYGLLAYNRGEYADALKSFDRINNEPAYRSTVPYYMAELEYYLGNREKALKDALHLIKRPEKLYYDNELHLLAAQCLFEGDRYGEALPYFEYYYNHTDKIRKEELYEMAYSYYRVSEWQHAIEGFRQLSTTKDSLGQTAMYLLGDSYLKAGDKASARNAFGICAGLAINAGQREAALLLYAQLSQALGFTDDAIRSATMLLKDYPQTARQNEAYDVLARVYTGTQNYGAAYRSMRLIKRRPESFNRLWQTVTYGYAIQQLQSGNISSADSLLDESLTEAINPSYTAAAAFWKAEIAGRQHRSEVAIRYAQQYLRSSKETGVMAPEATPGAAYRIIGYAAMDARDYAAAQQYFKKAGEDGSTSDAGIREADAYFMQKNFTAATALYAKAAAGNNSSYAQLQQAIIAGIKGRREEKIRLLQPLLNMVPPSAYAADARYEMGAAQMEGGDYRSAIETLAPLTRDANSARFAPKALLKTGAAWSLSGNGEKAEEAYVAILKNYSNSPERTDAMAALKSNYINQNNPQGYAALLQQYGIEANTNEELESAFYSAAEGRYAAQSWSDAATAFQHYLDKYPAGPNAVKARYYLAESRYSSKMYPQALENYDLLLQQPWNEFSEAAALRSASIYYEQKNWSGALDKYSLVRSHATDSNIARTALTGLMRSSAQLSLAPSDAPDVSAAARRLMVTGYYADSLLAISGLSSSVREEAVLYKARAAASAGDYQSADSLIYPLQLSHTAAFAAEARYYHAASLLAGGKLKESEDADSKNIKKGGGGDYWVVKSYILLGDILAAEKDYFNARATLESVADHAAVESLRAEAKRKLDALPAAEGTKLSNE